MKNLLSSLHFKNGKKELINFWNLASEPSDIIIFFRKKVDLLIQLAYKTKKRIASKACPEKEVLTLFDNLFDISVSDTLDKLKQDNLRDKETRQSDIIFLKDQKKTRLRYISGSADRSYRSRAIDEDKKEASKLEGETLKEIRAEKEKTAISNLLNPIKDDEYDNYFENMEEGNEDDNENDPEYFAPTNVEDVVFLKFNFTNFSSIFVTLKGAECPPNFYPPP